MRLKKSVKIMLFLLTAAFAVSGCGNNADTQESTAASGTTEQKNDENSPENMTGTEDKVGKDTVGDAADDVGDAAKDIADGAGDAAKDIVEGAGEAADDVADGVGDAIDNLGGGSFDSYDDAKTYLLEKLKKDNSGANYEVRDEIKDLTAYNNNDSGAEGYQFSVYETDGNEKIGIYYVDKDTGKIYRYMGKNSIEAY